MATITYPLPVHWIWSKEGWLSPFRTVDGINDIPDILLSNSMGAIDYAGGGKSGLLLEWFFKVVKAVVVEGVFVVVVSLVVC